MKKAVLLITQVCILLSITIVFSQENEPTVEELETKIERQKKIKELQKELRAINDDTSTLKPGISMGVGYFTGKLDEPLVGSASIDENGIVRVQDERQRITRLFPTITGMIRPFGNSDNWSNVYLGLTLGVNEGASNEGSGFAMAIGGSIGFAIGNVAHFGFFAGFVYDPSVQILPDGFVEGSEAPEGYGPNVPIETKSINARYLSTGFVFSIAL